MQSFYQLNISKHTNCMYCTVYYCWCDEVCGHLAFYWDVSIEQLSITGMEIINAPGSDCLRFIFHPIICESGVSFSLIGGCFICSPWCGGMFITTFFTIAEGFLPFDGLCVTVPLVCMRTFTAQQSFITLFILCKTLTKAHADRSLILELLEKRFGHVYISTYGIKLGDETAFHDYISWP